MNNRTEDKWWVSFQVGKAILAGVQAAKKYSMETKREICSEQ